MKGYQQAPINRIQQSENVSAYGQHADAPDQVGRVLLLDEVSQRVDNANERLVAYLIRVRDLNNSILGTAPSGGAANPPSAPAPVSRMFGLQSLTSTTHELLDALSVEVDRLATI